MGLTYYEQRLTVAGETGDHRGQGYALWGLGNMYADLGEREQAIVSYERPIELLQAIEDPNTETVRRLLARLEG